MNRKQLCTLFCLLFAGFSIAWAQGPGNSGTYYQAANGKNGQALKTALFNIIKNHKSIGYDGLYEAYKETDTRPDGYVRDWYSNATNYTHVKDKAGSYKKEGDCYNREHSLPQSWFESGGNAATLKCDIVHVLPTDGYINNMRSNHPLAKVGSVSGQSKNGYSKWGSCGVSGYSGTVFEPNDEIKGDMARIYFYVVTCYEENASKWCNNASASAVLKADKYKPFKDWYYNMLLEWAQQDPVDDLERARNEAVYRVQGNRNPFVDYPGLEDMIWGSNSEPFDYTNFSGSTTVTVHTPYFTPSGGTYTGAQTVTISCSTSGATIYYTTNGSTPTTSSSKYTQPITVSESCTLKAIAVKGSDQSNVATASYVIKQQGGGDDPVDPPSGDVIWQESFDGAAAGTPVEEIVNATATYEGDNGDHCKIYDESLAGGKAPELLIPKTSYNSNFKATISLGGIKGDLPLSYKCNKSTQTVSSETSGVTITANDVQNNTYHYTVSVPAGVQKLVLVFSSTTNQNARIDDIVLSKPAGDNPDEPAEPKDPELSFSQTSFTVVEGSSITAPTLNNPHQVEVVYSSSDTDIAAVNKTTGSVTIGQPGTVTITATFDGNDEYLPGSASYSITVEEKIVEKQDADLSFSSTEVTVEAETVDFDEPVLINPNDLDVIYSSSNDELAMVDAESGEVTIGSVSGTVVITATFGGDEEFKPKPIIKQDADLSFSPTEVTVEAESEEFDDPVLNNPHDLPVVYTSSDDDLAKVDAESGAVTIGATPGEVVITASFEGNDYFNAGSASYTIIITPKPIIKQDADLSFSVSEVTVEAECEDFEEPVLNNPNQLEVVFSSSDETLATVDAATGEVTIGATPGVVTITATFAGNDYFLEGSASYLITIKEREDTGIYSIGNTQWSEDLEIFDLQGKKIKNEKLKSKNGDTLPKGIYIMNGKKIVII